MRSRGTGPRLLPLLRVHVPVVLSPDGPDEVRLVLDRLTGVPRIIVSLLNGAGLRLQESLELRIKDLDFDRNQIVVVTSEPSGSCSATPM